MIETTVERSVTGTLMRPVDETVFVVDDGPRPLYVFSVPGRDTYVSYDVEAYDAMLLAAKQDAGLSSPMDSDRAS